jgi:Virulence-associated protein E
MTYDDLIQSLIDELQKQKNSGKRISATICVSQLDPDEDNWMMRDFAINVLKIKEKQFENALHKRTVEVAIGSYPESAAEYVKISTKRRQTAVKYNGVVSEPDYQFEDFSYVMQKLREQAVELRLRLAAAWINDSAEIWFTERKRERLPILRDHVKFDPSVEQAGTDALRKLAETCFDDDPDLVVAALKKFMHQVKRKMRGLPIERHLMTVFLGKQGGGKSTLAKRLISVLDELAVGVTIPDMQNDKVIDMWQNFIGFCDEMIGGNRADNATMKHVITAETLQRRPMRTNLWITVPQNLTFLGTSNATEFPEIIRDETGMRRYLGLTCKDSLDWGVINSTDWLVIWQSVDETAADPMLPFKEVLEVRQENHREKSRVEVWLDQLKPVKDMDLTPGRTVTGAILYAHFREFEEKWYPGHTKTDGVWFGRRLAATKNSPFKRTAKNGVWDFEPNQSEDQDDATAHKKAWKSSGLTDL